MKNMSNTVLCQWIRGVLIDRLINRQHRKKINPFNLLSVTVSFILVGLLIGYIDAFKSIEFWSNYYYIWDKIKDLLLVLTLRSFVPNVKAKEGLKYLSYFFSCRILWDILVIIQSFQVAASPIVMIIMFALLTTLIIYFMFQGMKEEWQRL
jgi:hypothetical protein